MPRNRRHIAVVICLVLCFSSLLFAQNSDQAEAAKVVTAMDKGVGFHVGQYDVSFSGEINGFYVHDRADTNATTLAADPGCTLCLASTGTVPNSSLRNGLLPGDLSIKISTQERGYDVAVFFGIWPTLQSVGSSPSDNLTGGQPTGFGTSGVDFRQQYLTVGRAHMGTFKLGRDLGMFGQEAILNDFTLLGAGTTNGNAGPGSVTLGRIGLGYIYTDFIPQISWTSPSAHGLQIAGGIFEPLTDAIQPTLLTGHGQPQFQGKLTFTVPTKGRYKAKLWTNFLSQSLEKNYGDKATALAVGQSVRATAGDYGIKLSMGAADIVVYGYNGWGIGTEGLLFLSTSPTGHTRPSQGYYAQGTYTFAKKTTVGASYGQSVLSPANTADLGNFTRLNASYIGQARYALTKWVNLVGEFTHTHSEGQARVITTSDSVALGAIAFF